MPKPLDRRFRNKEPEPSRLRGRRGVAQRKRRLDAEPLCRDCYAKGILTPSTVPDHIIPLGKGGPDTDDNIRCLCAPCHKARTAEQFGYQATFGTDVKGRPLDPSHPWNRR